jgi:hypothetical protein
VIAIGWQDNGYPSLDVGPYLAKYGPPVNHTAILLGWDNGNIILLEQWKGHPLSNDILHSPQGWFVVNVSAADQTAHGGSGGDGRGAGGVNLVDVFSMSTSLNNVSSAIGNAMNAVNNYALEHGPGIGIVTVTDSSGSHLVAAGSVGGGYYEGYSLADFSYSATGGDLSFAPGGGGWITQAILDRLLGH